MDNYAELDKLIFARLAEKKLRFRMLYLDRITVLCNQIVDDQANKTKWLDPQDVLRKRLRALREMGRLKVIGTCWALS